MKVGKMDKIPAALIAPCRGKDGDNVLPEVKWANVQKAIEVGDALRRHFPMLDLFVPHAHEEVIDQLWRNGLSSDEITDATAQIAARKVISFCYEGDGISEGMKKEINVVTAAGKPIILFTELDEETQGEIAITISAIMENVCQAEQLAEGR
jgi:hypothetical protein